MRRALVGGVVSGLLAGGLGVVAGASPAAAIASGTALPTVQVDGVVWSQVIVGNTVYATGMFANARPAGSAAGQNLTPRSNILAYDLTTGALKGSWAPSLNAQGLAIAASPDGQRIYVGGDFTQVNGKVRNRLAVFSAATGALLTDFQPGVNGTVRALQTIGDVVYAGGLFTSTGGNPRYRLAAFSATNGALLTWAPQANMGVRSLLALPAQNKIVVGGSFTTMNGVSNPGMTAVDATTAASLSWPANTVIRYNGGSGSVAIVGLSTDGSKVYGGGFSQAPYIPGRLEGSFATDLNGNLDWVNGCFGDQYGTYPSGDVLYQVGHAHDCSPLGGFMNEPEPNYYKRALSVSTTAQRTNAGGNFNGYPAPSLQSWRPYLDSGVITGMGQGPWHITGDGRYLVLGGEFRQVNGVGQQGLVRFYVNGAPAGTPAASDAFDRTVGLGWGRADLGGSWSGGSPASTNVALGKTATMSSTWPGYPASSGVDGNASTYYLTQLQTNAWWQVDLGASVAPVRLTLSSTEMSNFTVFGSNSDMSARSYTDLLNDPAVWKNTTPGGLNATIDIDTAGQNFRYVKVQLAGTGYNYLYELQVVVPPASSAVASVDAGSGKISVPKGQSGTMRLGAVSLAGADYTQTFWMESMPTGGGTFVAPLVRTTAAGDYRAKVFITSAGAVQVSLAKVVGGSETVLAGPTTVAGLTYAVGTKLHVRAQATGASPTTVRARVWRDGAAEPTTWQVSATDATDGLQISGAVGLWTYTSGSAVQPSVIRVDDLTVTSAG
ncbi:MAG: hypothetical protein IPG94_21120 [Kineosporiaceae bacterium]|nr:hypothetical protein [Kineosporiaceae bacterium]